MALKKLCGLILALVMLLSSYGCNKDAPNNESVSNQKGSTEQKSISNSYGSIDEDIVHEKNFVEASGWIYYHNPNDMNKIYKKSIDGSNNIKVIDNCMGSYCLDGEWIYYSDPFNNENLYRIKTDGSNNQKLNDDQSSSINVSKEWIYYRNSSDNERLYKIKKDGTDRTKLGDDSVWSIYVGGGDWIYYINSSENNHIYKIGMDAREKVKVTNTSSYSLCTSGDWIYYAGGESKEIDYPRIYKIKRDGTEETCLLSGKQYEVIYNLEALGDYIYYGTYNSEDAIYRVKKDGTDFERLSLEDEHIKGIYDVSKDGLIFTSTFYKGNIYKTDLKSKRDTVVNTPPEYNTKSFAEWIAYNDKQNNLGLNVDKTDIRDYPSIFYRITSKVKLIGNTAYFLVKTGDLNNLYKLDINNPKPKMIAEGKIDTYDVSGGLIHYYDSSDQTIYSIKTNGTGKKEVSKNKTEYIQVDGRWIYFTFTNKEIHRMRLDGTDEQKITSCNWANSPFKVYGDWIYYSDENGLFRIKTDGTGKKKLYEDINGAGDILYIKDGRIYFEIIIAEGGDNYGWISGLYSIKLDGTDKQTILEGTFVTWAISGNSVYYDKILRDINIIKSNQDGSERKVVVPNLIWR